MEQLREQITYTELFDWIRFIEQEFIREQKQVTKLDYYLAQIAAEILRGNQYITTARRNTIKTSDFFVRAKEEVREDPKTRLEKSRAALAQALGLKVSAP